MYSKKGNTERNLSVMQMNRKTASFKEQKTQKFDITQQNSVGDRILNKLTSQSLENPFHVKKRIAETALVGHQFMRRVSTMSSTTHGDSLRTSAV